MLATILPDGSEWIIILVIVLLLFGGSQLPKLARSIGQAQKEFKKGVSEGAEPDSGTEPDDKITPKD